MYVRVHSLRFSSRSSNCSPLNAKITFPSSVCARIYCAKISTPCLVLARVDRLRISMSRCGFPSRAEHVISSVAEKSPGLRFRYTFHHSLAQNCSICAKEEPQAQKADKANYHLPCCKTSLAATRRAARYYKGWWGSRLRAPSRAEHVISPRVPLQIHLMPLREACAAPRAPSEEKVANR